MKKPASQSSQPATKTVPAPAKGGKALVANQSKPFNADDFVSVTLPR